MSTSRQIATIAVVNSAAEVNTGTDNDKFTSALSLEESKYLNQSGSKVSATAAGTNTYTATIAPAITAYVATQVFDILFTNANTGACTLNLNTLGAGALTNSAGLPLVTGDILAGQRHTIARVGSGWRVISQVGIPGAFSGIVAYDSQITPATLAVDTHNYAPTDIGIANVVRVSSSSNIQLTGIIAPSPVAGQILLMINIGGSNITLVNSSASSTATNRFLMNGNKTLQGNESVQLCYDKISLRWRVISENI
jgi:hypothetical protein